MSEASQFNNFLGPGLILRQPNNFANSAAKLTTNTTSISYLIEGITSIKKDLT